MLFLLFSVGGSVVAEIKKVYIPPIYTLKNNPFATQVYNSVISSPQIAVELDLPKNEQIVFNGPRSKKQVALTFDADMTPQMKYDLESGSVASYFDWELINTLNETGTKSTLFLSGMWIESYLDEARELARNPLFELANHTYSHQGFEGTCFGLSPVDPAEKHNELIKTQRLLKSITGVDNKLFRFPGGCYSQEDLKLLKYNNLLAIQWDAPGQDGFNNSVASIIANVLNNVRNGSIIVLHMNGYPNEPVTAQALPFIIATLKQQGYEFVTVSELLEVTPAKNVARASPFLTLLN